MTNPTVTVLMAVFNAESYLREAIASVLSQTLPDFELVIVDDCSTDGSWPIVVDAASADNRILPVRRVAQGGASAALNLGLAQARGAYVTRQDGDDVSVPTRLAEQVAFLETHQEVGAAGTQAFFIDPAGAVLGVTSFPEVDSEIQPALLDRMCFIGPTVMARRDAFERAGFSFDEALAGSEDYDLCLRLAEVAALANLSGKLYRYRQHASSVSHHQRHRQLFRKALGLEKAMQRRFGESPPAEMRALVARDYLRAGVVAHAAGAATAREAYVASAVSTDPSVFGNIAAIEKMVRRYAPGAPIGSTLDFTRSVFDVVLPRNKRLNSLRRRLVRELHVRQLWSDVQQDPAKVKQHVWRALRSNPACVANRGVLRLLMRHGFGSARQTSSPQTR